MMSDNEIIGLIRTCVELATDEEGCQLFTMPEYEEIENFLQKIEKLKI